MNITSITEPFIKQLLCLLQILQNLGKVDRTADDIFDEHLTNFTRQQNAANRLQKEFNNYIRCIRGNNLIAETVEL
jgi:amphiphysin